MLAICSGVEFDEVREKKKENRCLGFTSFSKSESSLTDRRVPSKIPEVFSLVDLAQFPSRFWVANTRACTGKSNLKIAIEERGAKCIFIDC